MKQKMSKQELRNLYWTGWCILAAIILIAAGLRAVHMENRLDRTPCIFNTLTGLYCPGCGGTRAVIALLHGRLLESLTYHPVVIYGAGLYVWFMVSHTIEILSKEKYAVGMKYRDFYLYLAIIIVILHFVVRNLLLLLWGIRM